MDMNKFLLSAFAFVTFFALPGFTAELPDFADLVDKYSTSVVNVSTTRKVSQARNSRNRGRDNPLRRFFPDSPIPEGPQRDRQSLGSGFIISSDGYILTNNHVVDNSEEIVIRLSDRRELEAELIGADPRSDLALLKVDAKNLPTVILGVSETLRVGEWVLAIGSPFGFDSSVTAGIISAMGRSLPTQNQENYVPFIQTDVAINPGNSGGPLFNLDGEVIGINSQIYTRSGGFMGVSFAIPIDVAMEVVEQLKSSGSVSRGWLGVQIQEVGHDLVESFGLEKPAGALVAGVLDGGPAEKAGIQVQDIILKFNGSDINLSADLPHLVGRTRAGSVAKLVIVRDGKKMDLEVEVGELSSPDTTASISGPTEGGSSRLGLVVEELDPEQLRRQGARAGIGVTQSSGAAEDAGIIAGDIIVRLNNRETASLELFNEIADSLEGGRSVPVLIIRQGVPTFLALRVPVEKDSAQ